ncbi:MAG: hypothetical protein IKP07_03635 [Bacilli bacterium]|nr:hypothetical protein [Bacilli bacterium]
MKNVELTEREIETLKGILAVEESDLETLKAKTKKTGQEQDFIEIGNELAVVQSILTKLK